VLFNGKGHGKMWELNGFIQFDLNKTLDFASMCHSLEVRSPFLDHRLVEMALSIPESKHRAEGNKTILKRMLRKFGFNDQFLNRPKIGFSLHKTPTRMPELIKKALNWCITNKYLVCDWNTLNGRDQRYLEMSCLGFYYWYHTWKEKIKTNADYSILIMDQEDFPTS
jgi:asparagine synthetase B (glutamine-hydrolysing)